MFIDALTLDAPKRTKDGYMAVRARAARTGTYAYLGSEIDPDNQHGLRDAGVVNVLRDDKTVFDEASARSFIGKPVTDDHPSAPVNATNWRDYARGMIMGAMRDGDYLAFDLLLTDAEAIKKIGDGKRELSNGYAADLEFGDFEAADGTKCVARQASISGNHVALVDKGRAGSECAIADAATCDSATAEIAKLLLDQILTDERTYSGSRDGHTNNPTNVVRQSGDIQMPHTLIIDGLQVTEVSDQAKAAIEKLQGQVTKLTADKDAAETKVGELTATVSTKDGEIAALEQKVKDAEVSPAQLEKLVADRAALIAQAKGVDPSVVTDGKTEAEIRKAVVSAKLGDAAKDMNDGAISGAFAVLSKDVKTLDPIRNELSGGVVNLGDAQADYDKAMNDRRADLRDAWKGAPAAA
jgi:hypothetical protein